ncbi:hypothetical protein [Micromonospora sp. NPDC000018]|uniref:hypothetical protein n=1 Tax=Micromonospora sp. NPDC000018 TaxID=3154239 RepID=UPI003324109E
MTGDSVMLDGSQPFQERVRHLRDAWVRDGRGRAFLLTGTAFFAAYCWSLNNKISDPTAPAYDAKLAEFVTAGSSGHCNGAGSGRDLHLVPPV